MCQKKKNSPSDKDVFYDIFKQLEECNEDDTTFVVIVHTGGTRHVGVKGNGENLSGMIRDLFAQPDNDTIDSLAKVVMTGMAGAMLDNDGLFGLADHLIEMAGNMRVENARTKSKEVVS